MEFDWPIMLCSLLFIPLIIAVYVGLQRRRRKIVENYGSLGIVQEAGRQPGLRRHVPAGLFLLGLGILFVSLGRPQTVVSVPRAMGTVILAFDVSGSMAADDLKPTRMEAAKVAARAFVEGQPATVDMGVVGFSDGGFEIEPPTNDKQAVLDSIERLRPRRGTAVAQGIIAALTAIATAYGDNAAGDSYFNPAAPTLIAVPAPAGWYDSAVIVLLTDGENNQNPSPLLAAQAAADRGVRIHTVGLGSPTGTVLEINDFRVHTQLNEPLLRQIAAISGGEYFAAATEDELKAIYSSIPLKFVIETQRTEVTSPLAGFGLLVLLVSGVISLAWFSRWP